MARNLLGFLFSILFVFSDVWCFNMIVRKRLWALFAIYSFVLHFAVAQQRPRPDSVDIIKVDTTNRIIDAVKDNRVSKELLKSVMRKPPGDDIINVRSEEAFLPFEGKIIRQILINHIGFERSITDTTRNIKNAFVKVGNALHSNTKEW